MDKDFSINERINLIFLRFYKNKKSFAEALGLTSGGIGKILNNESIPSVTIAARLLEIHPNVSAEWLMRGEGDIELNNEETEYFDNIEREFSSIEFKFIKVFQMHNELRSEIEKRFSELEQKLPNK